MIYKLTILLLSFVSMEAFAWFSHKYIMHGIMWRWHESHHKNHHSILEKNDLFSIIFGLLAIILILIGSIFEKYQLLIWIGGGVTLYGIFYFIFHDIIVHKRIKHQFSFRNKYLKRIIKAHHIHHKLSTKEGAEAFGFLYADKKYSSKNNS